MILTCNYEEMIALDAGARAYLDSGSDPQSRVAAPSASRVAVESLLDQLDGDLSLTTLAEQMEVERAVVAVVDHLRTEMDARVLAAHPADEHAVGAYFEFAHALAVLGRLQQIGDEMTAMVEVMTGAPADEAAIVDFVFPD